MPVKEYVTGAALAGNETQKHKPSSIRMRMTA